MRDDEQRPWPEGPSDVGPDELIAYREGRMTPAEEDACREKLAASPASVEQLLDLDGFADLAPPPEERLSDGQVAAAWDDVSGRIAGRGEVVPLQPRNRAPLRWLALAAGLAAAAAGLAGTSAWLWSSRRAVEADRAALQARVEALVEAQSRPRINVAMVELYPPGFYRRSGETATLDVPAGAGTVHVLLSLPQPSAGEVFALRIADAAGATVWDGGGLVATEANTVSVALARELLTPGRYRFELSEGPPGARRHLGDYDLEIRFVEK